jgi:DNA modification methylase
MVRQSDWKKEWQLFKQNLPHKNEPFAKRNWGHPLHSLCSYQGKMKPSLAYFLIKTFTKSGDTILDPFAGVGTIPFEGALNGVRSFGFDISSAALSIAKAKLGNINRDESIALIKKLEKYIQNRKLSSKILETAKEFGFNKKLADYFEARTLKEIILAREFFKENPPGSPSEHLVFSCLLHILHGNRPYALSRRSHGITPFAPTGEFEYKNVVSHLKDKVERSFAIALPEDFVEGDMFFQDATSWWPRHIENLDAIITSPPFFDSTRFYLANWLRLWLSGWDKEDFEKRPFGFVDEKQKLGFEIYEPILRQARERLKPDGVVVFHLGKSSKCDMAEKLADVAKKWFKVADIFEESVEDGESHGIRDKGTVVKHQFLILQ